MSEKTMEMDSTCLLKMLGYLRNQWKIRGPVEGDAGTVEMIEEEMQKLRPTLTPEEAERIRRRKQPEEWRQELEEVKDLVIQEWEEGAALHGWFHVRGIVKRAKQHPHLKHCSEETVSRRVRDAADPKVENPPFLFHWMPGVNTGKYRINVNAVRALEPEEKKGLK
jgi:hypothetical protein